MEFLYDILAFFISLHWDVLAKVVGIDLILGLDNAIVIALACAMLAPELRNKAIIIGTAGAILARILFLFIGFWLVGLPFVKLVAGAYLIYLAYGMLSSGGDDSDHGVKAKTTMWGAAVTIVSADLLMSLDNVVALVGAAEGTGSHAFGYTVFGILLSIPIIIFASKGLIALIAKFPVIVWLGGALIAFVGSEMLLKEPFIATWLGTDHTSALLAATVLTTCTVGLALAKKLKPKAVSVV
jgi:YjbE family integral membrane protein